MSQFRKINERNQITIPPDVLEQIGAPPGGFFEIAASRNCITLTPRKMASVREPAVDADWGALKRFVQDQTMRGEYTEYPSAHAARKHLRKSRKP